MEEFFFTKGFQFEKYIKERLLEIVDEGERRMLKELLQATLIPFYEQTENAYAKLEKRLEQTQEKQKERYEIITGVAVRTQVDITEEAMVPMRYEDLHPFLVDGEEMKRSVQNGNPYTVMKVFIKKEYTDIRRIEQEVRNFNGILYTATGEYPAVFRLQKNQSYLEQIASLYAVFEKNGVEWNTVCAPYLGKYFDVQVIRTEAPMEEEIVRIAVDFEEYKEAVIYDWIPMWNVRLREERTSAYPDFSLDRIHYDHCIFKGRFAPDRDYLVANEDIRIWNVFRSDGDMHILCSEENPVRWKLIELGYEAKEKQFAMPVFGNRGIVSGERRCIHTEAEIKRYVSELGYEPYLQLVEVKQAADYPEQQICTYSMDKFIEEEIRVGERRSYMIFVFHPVERDHFLNQDIMSYVVSKMQWQLPEFICVGEWE